MSLYEERIAERAAQKEEDRETFARIRKYVILALTGIFCVSGFFSSCTTVDAGTVGVVKHFGAIQSYTLDQGLHFVRPWMFASVEHFNVKMRKAEVKAEAASKDMQNVSAVLEIQFSIRRSMVPKVVQKFGTGDSMAVTVMTPAVQEVLKDVMSKYSAEELITKRAEVKAKVETGLITFIDRTLKNKGVSGAINIANIAITDFDFSKQFNASIEAKVRVEQEAQKEILEKKKKITKAEAAAAEKRLAADATAYSMEKKADAEAYATKTVAVAKAEAIEVEAKALRSQPQLIELRRVEKWDGKLPVTMLSKGSTPMIKIN